MNKSSQSKKKRKSKKPKVNLIVQFEIEGVHRWPNAPQKYKYLSYFHRHVFNWKVYISVTDLNREIEFIDFSNKLKTKIEKSFKLYSTTIRKERCTFFSDGDGIHWEIINFKHYSCEQLAQLTTEIVKQMGYKCSCVEVYEDNENGARYETE